MKFVGVIAFDSGRNEDLESRHTESASFKEISNWFQAVTEFHRGELNYDPNCKWAEIRVMVYVDGPDLYTINAEPIETVVMRNPYKSL